MDTTQRDELAHTLKQSEAGQTSLEHKLAFHQQTAGDLLAAGYCKPVVLGYVVIGRDGGVVTGTSYKTHSEANAIAVEWSIAAKVNDIDWEYSVAEVVAAGR